jgi:hypothetical protein
MESYNSHLTNRDCLALANRLEGAAERAERGGGQGNGVSEDAVAVLHWAAQYLRRPTMQDVDLEGVLAVLQRILPGFDFGPSEHRVILQTGPAASMGRPSLPASRLAVR